MIQRLFIYGTMAPGRANQDVLSSIPGYWESATVTGKWTDVRQASSSDRTVIVLDEAGETIRGFIFTSDRLNDHWARLDEFEGQACQRVQAAVRRSDGALVDAHVYVSRITDTDHDHDAE